MKNYKTLIISIAAIAAVGGFYYLDNSWLD